MEQALRGDCLMSKTWYTQRQWDRVVGWGKVPKEYNNEEENYDDYHDTYSTYDIEHSYEYILKKINIGEDIESFIKNIYKSRKILFI